MASFSMLDARTVAVEVPVSKPVIIHPEMKLQDWKNCFMQHKTEATAPSEKVNYNECLKTLLYAELCNANLVKVGISRPNGSLAVKFTFEFSNHDCLKVFQENLIIVTVVSQQIF